MKQKTSTLHIRLSPDDKKAIEDRMAKLGLTTPRKRSQYLRYRLLSEDLLPIPSDTTWQALIQAFADMVRIGSLLNQVAHHINRRYLEIVNLDGDSIELDGSRLHTILKNLEQGQHAIRREIIQIGERGRSR